MVKRQRVGARHWWRNINAPLVAAVVATLLSVLAYAGHRKTWWSIPGLDELELTTVDARFRLRGERAPASGDYVIVGVDDETRTRYPEVFQTRRGWATLIDALSGYEPRAIGMDLFFASPEVSLRPDTVTAVRAAEAAFRGDAAPKTAAGASALAALGKVLEETRGDELLAAAIKRSARVYMGLLFYLAKPGEAAAGADAKEPPGAGGARFGEAVSVAAPDSQRPPRATWISSSLVPIAEAQVGAGYVNVLPDPDGEVRRMPLVLEYGGRFYMSLGMSMALALSGEDSSYVVGDDEVHLGSRRAPISPRGEAYLSFLGGKQSFPRYSAAAILAGEVPAAALRDKLVFVGFTDAARDKIATPFDTQVDGVELHATLAHNLLHDELLRHSSPMTTLLTIALLGALLTVVQIRRVRTRRAWLVGAAALAATAGYLIAAHLAFSGAGLVLDVAAPLVSCVLISMVSLATVLVTEGRDKRELRAAFSQYVSETLVDRIASDPSRAALVLGGVRRDLTVLFSDIRGFSRFSERLDPETLSNYLNEYLTPMTEQVMDDGGLLDKYIGDAVMAVYGAPLEMADHAERACQSALAMQARLGPLNRSWHRRELPEIAIGIGLNTGAMAVGNMGSAARFDYTVMGDAVNLGARLESLTKEYGVEILCGEATAEAATGRFVFRELDVVRVKGRDGAARVFELVGERGSAPLSDDDLDCFNAGLAAYRAREWDQALAHFDEMLEHHSDDGPARIMRERVLKLRVEPPPEDWDGVYAQVSK